MQIPLVDLKAQYNNIRSEVGQAIQKVLESTNFILGEEVSQFESEYAKFVNTAGAVSVASGTAALELALLACGVGPDDEVITTAHTFIATAEAIFHVGAKPVFVDIDAKTYNMDTNLVEEAITKRTRAILPVHLYGQPAEMNALLGIANRHGLWLIEDAAQAHGAEYFGKLCGNIGHLACFSFYPGKNLGAYGDGGMVTGSDSGKLLKIKKLRDHGRISKYEHDEIGYGERLDALQAAILRVKLPLLKKWTEARRYHAKTYAELLSSTHLTLPVEAKGAKHVYHLYVVRTPYRDKLLACLKEAGIGAGIHYPIPLHRQPAFLKLGYQGVHLPETEKAAQEIMSLPMYPELSNDQIEYVVSTIKNFEEKL
jgi:dTDP-4-amino-4,6-dideoxygalactose transaminase